jgi:hypothetical protein
VLAAEAAQVVGTEPALVGAQHQVTQLPRETRRLDGSAHRVGPAVGAAGEQLAHPDRLLGTGEQPWRRLAAPRGLPA